MSIKYISVLLFISLLFIGQASAITTISLQENYQDYQGNWHKYTDVRGIS